MSPLPQAKTIDLCNNPKTKEPKLQAARRILPEWEGLDRMQAEATGGAGGGGDGDSAALPGAGVGAGRTAEGGKSEGGKAHDEL